jgi:hypothetical protein
MRGNGKVTLNAAILNISIPAIFSFLEIDHVHILHKVDQVATN